MTKYRKMPFLHHISANSHTCGSDAITLIEYMSSLEITLTVCQNLGLLRFSFPKIEGCCTKIRSQLVKNFSFDHFWVLKNSKFFLVSNVISCFLTAFVVDLKWRQHRRPCFRSRKHHRRIVALTSRLAGLALHVPFWLSLISQHRPWRSQKFVPVCIHSVSQSLLIAKLTRLLSFFAQIFLTTSIFVSIIKDTPESIFSRSCRHMLEPF